MEATKDIMYVGLQKAPSSDRPNGRPDRIWNGPGDIVVGIPMQQALTLLRHPDEWEDVSKLSGPDRQKRAQAAIAETEERLRVLHNPPGSKRAEKALDAASDAELMAELERRNLRQQRVEAAADIERPKAIEPDPKPSGAEMTQKILEAVEAVAARAAENEGLKHLLDDDGVPTLAAVQEELGFSLTEDEYRVALGVETA